MSVFRLKQDLVDPVDLHGVLRVRLGSQDNVFVSTYFTRLDQALIVWGVVTAAIFLVAQFCYLDWRIQAIVWSALSCAAILLVGRLAWFWVTTRNQRWILYGWSLLVMAGLVSTGYGILSAWGFLLRNLCSIWLGISAFGYFATGIGMQAQALILIGIVHICAIPILIVLPNWPFLLTGLVMSGSLFCLAVFQWEHY
ncbi:hypothetical protein IQ260_04100 [Leptolyngbya cf. ectocarpi LEGE 11479]|uniref:DUF2157 domain-containing protein n=1 Tax=Leptolyngbya cf. ectocarpi LEGE 11479 TaxID=1828722 RepID=A0A928ZQ30_LEPEC|nr:hypothetical protein [Leptolyngbya ectocarpi]MBE9065830.1 hypothetical protein [Leptolyngbya cf. ectocarpi LEGE 11479]